MSEATTKLIHHNLDVNSWLKIDPDVDAARPSHCPGCSKPAYVGSRLRLHGHGRRQRTLWGPSEVDARPEIRTVLARRYRCVDCVSVCTVVPRGIARRFLYGLAAIAVALLLWGLRSWTPAQTRAVVSPNSLVGLCEPDRWRSLSRWSRRAPELFALPKARVATDREAACRVAHVLIARGPPGVEQRRRAFVGAHTR